MFSLFKKDDSDNKRYGSVETLQIPQKQQPYNHIPESNQQQGNDPVAELTQQNTLLRRKLKLLSYKLDEEIEKAANNKYKHSPVPVKALADNSSNELKAAYKIIERLQRSIKQYQSNQGYNSSLNKILDLEDVIRKKQKENEQLKGEIKTLKKLNKQHEKYIEQLTENQKKPGNPAQDKQEIRRLKQRIKKMTADIESLNRDNRVKHQKVANLQEKTRRLERELEYQPEDKQESPLQENPGFRDLKDKYKDALDKLSKQAIIITKYKQRIDQLQSIVASVKQSPRRMQRSTQRNRVTSGSGRSGLVMPQVQHIPEDIYSKRTRNSRGGYY